MNTTQRLMLVSAFSRLDPSKLASILRDDRAHRCWIPAYQETAYRCKYSLPALEPLPKLAKYLQLADHPPSKVLFSFGIPFRTCRTCVEPEVIISISSHLNSCSSLPTLMIHRDRQPPPTAGPTLWLKECFSRLKFSSSLPHLSTIWKPQKPRQS